jgi:hypothetical protein
MKQPRDSWTCLMVKDGPGMLSDDVRTALKMAACELYRCQWERMHIDSDACEGLIETTWSTHSIGTLSGVLFRTEIVAENGSYKVNFLLNSDDLERGADVLREMIENGEYGWQSADETFACPELYRFYDLHQPGRMLN